MTAGVLTATKVHVAFGPRTALCGVSCSFQRGWTAIVGPNGAGKSSLLRVLAGLTQPAQGTVHLDGQALSSLTAMQRGQRIAWLDQLGNTSGELTVRETVALGRLPHYGTLGSPSAADAAAVDQALSAAGCAAWQHRLLNELSGGERQRSLLARALATQAPVLLLDEPTTHLDPPHQVALVRLARRLARTHTVLTVMHDLALAMAADRVLLLQAGQVGADAPAADLDLHRALEAAFDGAIKIEMLAGRPIVLPQL